MSHENGARRRSGARESVWGSPRGEAPRLVLSEAGDVVIEARLERGHALAGQLELFAGMLDLHLEARDALFEFDGLWQTEFGRGRTGDGSALTATVQGGMSVNIRNAFVTSNNSRARPYC